MSSCSKNDNSAVGGSIVGKWTVVQTVISLGGAPVQTIPYDGNIAGCSKNYTEFLAGGEAKGVEYSKVNTVCTATTEQGTWVLTGNNLKTTFGTDVSNTTITSVNAAQMIVSGTEVQSGVTYTYSITFARI